MNKYYEEKLPEGYVSVKSVDADNKKFGILMNLAALLIAASFGFIGWLITSPGLRSFITKSWAVFIFFAGIIIYLILHELVHGAAYKLMTKRKLTFGVSLTCAFCGVPDVFVYRITALCSLAAPLVTFTVALVIPLFFISDPFARFFIILALGIHSGGCSGDIYDIILFLFKFRDPKTLMNDTGPKQTFYVPSTDDRQK